MGKSQASKTIPTLDDAIQLFANYARGDGGFDELDLKEVIFDGVVAAEKKAIREKTKILTQAADAAKWSQIQVVYKDDIQGLIEGEQKRIAKLLASELAHPEKDLLYLIAI
jgi:hypothetical protein